MKKALLITLYILAFLILAAAIIVTLLDEGLSTTLITRIVCAVAALLVGIFRVFDGNPTAAQGNRAVYQRNYADFIGQAFSGDKKVLKQFYAAVDLYAKKQPDKALERFETLRSACKTQEDSHAVFAFMGLSCHDLRLWPEALGHYTAAMAIRPHSTLSSNAGICYERMGKYEQAMEAYQQAIVLNRENAIAYSNVAQMMLRLGEYISAYEYAQKALQQDRRLPQALSASAICHYMWGDMEQYEEYYRKAVSCGSDGEKLKQYIRSLDTTL